MMPQATTVDEHDKRRLSILLLYYILTINYYLLCYTACCKVLINNYRIF